MRALPGMGFKSSALRDTDSYAPIEYWLVHQVLNLGKGDRYPLGAQVTLKQTCKGHSPRVTQTESLTDGWVVRSTYVQAKVASDPPKVTKRVRFLLGVPSSHRLAVRPAVFQSAYRGSTPLASTRIAYHTKPRLASRGRDNNPLPWGDLIRGSNLRPDALR